jgi:hypothetical protein
MAFSFVAEAVDATCAHDVAAMLDARGATSTGISGQELVAFVLCRDKGQRAQAPPRPTISITQGADLSESRAAIATLQLALDAANDGIRDTNMHNKKPAEAGSH